jgi:putative nucleotidyltransferase with HDIG domain
MTAPGEMIRRLRENGHSAYLVGGCVRDTLLKIPVSDFDIATSATPEEVQKLFPHARLVGAHFGVVMVDDVEIATYRSDFAYSDGRRPDQVRYEEDPEADARRRDFTINALFLDPETGDILDFVGGRQDLQNRIIRAIGDPEARFREDHLRMLRAVRFAARLCFTIEPETFGAIKKLARKINQIAPERIRGELDRMLTEGHADRAFGLLDQTGLLQEVLPEVSAFHGVEQPPEFHPEGDVWVHVMQMLAGLKSPPATLAWGVLLHDAGKPGTFQRLDRIRFNGHVELGVEIGRKIANRLRFSTEVKDQVLALIANHMRFGDVHRMKDSTLKRFLRLPSFEEHLELHRLDCLASHGHLDNYNFAKAKFEETPPAEIKPERLLTGRDLIAAGWTPGPEFRRVLDEVEDAQMEGIVTTKEAALELAEQRRSFSRQ